MLNGRLIYTSSSLDSLNELNDYLWSEESPYSHADVRWQISQSHRTYYAMMTSESSLPSSILWSYGEQKKLLLIVRHIVQYAVVSAGSGSTERSAKMEAARKYMNEVKGGHR